MASPSPPSPPRINEAFEDDTIRIMLATDNHIGFNERDPVRGQDSINTFREILELAVKHDVDFVLLAGDLFHENKPSRDCLYKTVALLREYTLGDKPLQIELLSDPYEGKADGFSFPAINCEDPNLNVGIPVFSIHGNHDDPQGTGAEGALCALDVLSVAGLLNYMGKFDLPSSEAQVDSEEGIAVRPVLLRKGNTHLAMYGIGNVKDQRMHFELRSNRVKMFMPKNKDDWFNILLLHQNRVKHGPQDYVPEGMFDDSVDLVVWGHEHDCHIAPEPVAGKNYYITQPGSSVATSLADGEALEKQVALLKIQGKEFEMTPIPLRTVRPFVIEEIVLGDVAEEEGLDLSSQLEINKFLKEKIQALVDKANALWDERNARAQENGEEPLKRMLPLVRLKVETTGVTETSNPVRFGQDFFDKVANPRDVLVFHRAKKSGKRGQKVAADEPELSIDDPDLTAGEKLEKVRVASLVKEYLAAQELQLLGEVGMSDAIRLFVEKDDTHAIHSHVGQELKSLVKSLNPAENLTEEEVQELLEQAKEEYEKEYVEAKKAGKKTTQGKGKSKAVESDNESVDSMAMEIDIPAHVSDSEEEVRPVKKRAATTKAKSTTSKKVPPKKAPTKGKGKQKQDSDSDDQEVIEIDDDDNDDIEEDEPPPPKKKTSRAAILSQTAKKAAPKRKAVASTGGSKQSQLNFAPAGRSSRAAATRAKGKMVVDDDSDDD